MSSIYDKKENREILDGGRTGGTPKKTTQQQIVAEPEQALSTYDDRGQYKESLPIDSEIASYQERSQNAMQLVDDIVLKNYLTKLSSLDIVPVKDTLPTDDIILFKINKMIYEKDEYATDKFISVVSAMTYTYSSIYLIVEGKGETTEFYLGIKCEDDQRSKSSVAETFRSSMLGQFPGAVLEDYSPIEVGAKFSRQDKLLQHIKDAVSVSSCVGIPSYKNSKGEYTNANFIQGIEKFALAMQGKNIQLLFLPPISLARK